MDKIYEHKFIVFGDEHYNPLGVVRSLGEFGIKPDVIVQRHKPHTTSASKYVGNKYIVDSVNEGYNILVSKYGGVEQKPFVITTDDTVSSYLDNRYNELKNQFYFFNAGESGRISYYMDKNILNEIARKHRFNVLKTWVVRDKLIPEDIEYPVLTKASNSIKPGWKNLVHICNNEKELKKALDEIGNQEILIQKYLHKKNELCIDGFSVNKGTEVALTMGSSYNYLLDDSFSCNMTLFNITDKSLIEKITLILQEIAYEGIFTIEFLIDESDNLWFMEINFRNSAWSWASTKLGMNMPILWAKGMIINHLSDSWYCSIPDNYKAIVELSDYRSRVKTHKIKTLDWIKEIHSADCVFLWDKNDKKPVFNELMGIIRRKLSGNDGK